MPRRRLNYIDLVPKEVLTNNIFTRLPLKSLGRCKCVSEPWNSFISDPHFVKIHLTKTSTDDSKFIFISHSGCPLYSAVVDSNLHYVHRSRLNFNCSDSWSRIWGSCDGLVLADRDQTWRNMYLLNPTTLESKQLPVLPSLRSKHKNIAYMFGFGYDSLSDDYAVVSISFWPCRLIKVAHVYVYMLKKNYWDKVGLSPCDYKDCKGGAGMFVGGSLHWLAKNVDGSSWLISAFTIANKEFSQLPVPNGEKNLVEMDSGRCFLVVTTAEEAKPYNRTKVSSSQWITEAGMAYVESLVSLNNKDAHQKEKIRRRSKTIK